MNKYCLRILLLLVALYNGVILAAARGEHRLRPLLYAAVAIDASYGKRASFFPERNGVKAFCFEGVSCVGTRETDLPIGRVTVKLLMYKKGTGSEEAHIGIGIGDPGWGVTDEEASMAPSKELIQLVHDETKCLLQEHGITKLDTMSGKGRAGTLLSHFVSAYRSYYQQFKPRLLTFNSRMLVKASSYQYHMALAELLATSDYSKCKEMYIPLEADSVKIFSGYSSEDGILLNRLTWRASSSENCYSKNWSEFRIPKSVASMGLGSREFEGRPSLGSLLDFSMRSGGTRYEKDTRDHRDCGCPNPWGGNEGLGLDDPVSAKQDQYGRDAGSDIRERHKEYRDHCQRVADEREEER